jgi:hypothetical protein
VSPNCMRLSIVIDIYAKVPMFDRVERVVMYMDSIKCMLRSSKPNQNLQSWRTQGNMLVPEAYQNMRMHFSVHSCIGLSRSSYSNKTAFNLPWRKNG